MVRRFVYSQHTRHNSSRRPHPQRLRVDELHGARARPVCLGCPRSRSRRQGTPAHPRTRAPRICVYTPTGHTHSGSYTNLPLPLHYMLVCWQLRCCSCSCGVAVAPRKPLLLCLIPLDHAQFQRNRSAAAVPSGAMHTHKFARCTTAWVGKSKHFF